MLLSSVTFVSELASDCFGPSVSKLVFYAQSAGIGPSFLYIYFFAFEWNRSIISVHFDAEASKS